MSLLYQTLGYFQDIVFSSEVAAPSANKSDSDAVVQYIDLISLVVKENIETIKRSCRSEMLHTASRSVRGGGCGDVDYMERERQGEEIDALVQHRLRLSIATPSDSRGGNFS
eukprot:CAMPEP_0114477018 /NCGR_PEP_ID=MMETSP0104-20121206/15100_1 /TAXON_ID=37642 ORGANISM="Paraphysomonas imperforata, Strain PA2" /NCGR_SAMPLE_ID=MMETSP0104 /ASSEMBLY_ACC=CAM_ASM_000202 /LENGTH=111 /DNA_ID=CAMNT_0001651859 /DNA_START=352 /DNA_END=683 /DNA_ORIENTATION=-